MHMRILNLEGPLVKRAESQKLWSEYYRVWKSWTQNIPTCEIFHANYVQRIFDQNYFLFGKFPIRGSTTSNNPEIGLPQMSKALALNYVEFEKSNMV